MQKADKYINPFTDYGFKRLFGEEPNKDLLLDFLNELLKEEEGEIKSISYIKTEQLGINELDRKAIFDLYCENEKGEKFIVELQKSKQNFFKDRTVFYSTFPIREQAKRAEWNFELKAVYAIAILDFVFDEDKDQKDKFRYDVKLTDIETCKVFYDKLTFIYLEMPKFNKSIDELETRFEKWMYVIKNLSDIDDIPDLLKEHTFQKLFKVAEIANFNRDQLNAYEGSLKYYRDLNNTIETAKDEARKEVENEIAKNMIIEDEPFEKISKFTGISIEKLALLKSQLEKNGLVATASNKITEIKNQFPILQQEVNGKPLVYLDNAATSQKPQMVIDAITNYYTKYNSNIHRGAHYLAEQATIEYENARIKVQQFVNAESDKLINFTRASQQFSALANYCRTEKMQH